MEAFGSIDIHKRELGIYKYQHHKRLCDCGCKTKATHTGLCNGVVMIAGCELSMRRWVKQGSAGRFFGRRNK